MTPWWTNAVRKHRNSGSHAGAPRRGYRRNEGHGLLETWTHVSRFLDFLSQTVGGVALEHGVARDLLKDFRENRAHGPTTSSVRMPGVSLPVGAPPDTERSFRSATVVHLEILP